MNQTGKGGFRKGRSGNPGGRPKAAASLAAEARKHMPEMLAVLLKNAREGSTAAAIAVLDRGFGKPAQSMDMRLLLEKRLSELTPGELERLEANLISMGADQDEEGSNGLH